MTHAFRLHQTGGPEVLAWEQVEVPAPAAGEAIVRHHAVGLNFIDIYHRTGLYPLPLPSGIGLEGAGVVEAIGEGVTEVRVGDRVAYAGGPVGAYAEVRNIPAHRLLRLPEGIGFNTAAAMMLQGLTAAYLLRAGNQTPYCRRRPVRPVWQRCPNPCPACAPHSGPRCQFRG